MGCLRLDILEQSFVQMQIVYKRALGIDPLADQGGQQTLSPYHAMGCNPALMVDSLGLLSNPNNDISSPYLTLKTPMPVYIPIKGNSVWNIINRFENIPILSPSELARQELYSKLIVASLVEGIFSGRGAVLYSGLFSGGIGGSDGALACADCGQSGEAKALTINGGNSILENSLTDNTEVELSEVVVIGKRKTRAGKALQKVSVFFEKIASGVTLTVTGAIMPIINETKVMVKEGIHSGRAYNQESNVSWAVPYVIEGWKLVRRDDLMTTGNLSSHQSSEVIQSTTNTLLLIPTISSGPTRFIIINKGIEQVIKNGVKQGVKYGTNN